jgi:hypothetical protein
MYALKSGSLCDIRDSHIASDPADCNRLARVTPFFSALLNGMHPRTEALLMEDVQGYGGNFVRAAFFVGSNGRPQILLDFSRIAAGQWDLSKGFKLKVHHGDGLVDLPLGRSVDSAGLLYQVDDPGVLKRRRGDCGGAFCPAVLLLYGYGMHPARDTEGAEVATNLADIKINERLEHRFAFYAALLGKPASLSAPLPVAAYTIERFGVTTFDTVHLERKLAEIFGSDAAARIDYGAVGYRVAFGQVFAIRLDGALYTLWDGGPGYPSLGTDRMVFDVVSLLGRRRLEGVRSARGLYVLPYSGTDRLEVRKYVAQDGEPWSSFDRMSDLIAELRRRGA